MPPCFPDVLGSLQRSPARVQRGSRQVPVLPEPGQRKGLQHFPLPRATGVLVGRAGEHRASLWPSFLALLGAARGCWCSNEPGGRPCGPLLVAAPIPECSAWLRLCHLPLSYTARGGGSGARTGSGQQGRASQHMAPRPVWGLNPGPGPTGDFLTQTFLGVRVHPVASCGCGCQPWKMGPSSPRPDGTSEVSFTPPRSPAGGQP